MNKLRIASAATALIAITVLGGCQSGGGTRKDVGVATETTVEARAAQRWKYLIAKEPAKAYDYLTPGFRKATPRENYAATMGNRPVKWKSATVGNKECTEDLCDVFLTLDYEVTIPGGGGRPVLTFAPLREKWVKVADQWYFLPQK